MSSFIIFFFDFIKSMYYVYFKIFTASNLVVETFVYIIFKQKLSRNFCRCSTRTSTTSIVQLLIETKETLFSQRNILKFQNKEQTNNGYLSSITSTNGRNLFLHLFDFSFNLFLSVKKKGFKW
jgi:hypothetical protein